VEVDAFRVYAVHAPFGHGYLFEYFRAEFFYPGGERALADKFFNSSEGPVPGGLGVSYPECGAVYGVADGRGNADVYLALHARDLFYLGEDLFRIHAEIYE
jgi:hypothetical protein